MIQITESLLTTKASKEYDPKVDNNNNNNNNIETDNQSQINNNDNTQNNNSNNNNNNNNNLKNDEKPMKQTPREWGVEKEHYEINERCQVKFEDDGR